MVNDHGHVKEGEPARLGGMVRGGGRTTPMPITALFEKPPSVVQRRVRDGSILRPSLTLAPGTRLGAYEVLAPLGIGGMGEVYLARDPKLGREVAIKVLPSEVSSSEDRRARFEREARAASALNHPNIVTIHDFAAAGPTFYMVMERVDGHTLRELLATGPLPVKRIVEIGAQIADGLAKAHAADIVHRDLKPENVMVTTDGFVKILDFGLAKLQPPDASGPLGGAHGHAPRAGHGCGGRARDRRLHVPGTGERSISGLPFGPVLPGHDPVRDGHREARLPTDYGRRDPRRHHQGRARAHRFAQSRRPGGSSAHHRALFGQGGSSPVCLDTGPRPRPARRPNHGGRGGGLAAARRHHRVR